MKEYLKIADRERRNIKKYVRKVSELSYNQYGIFQDDDGNLYYQFTDDCSEIERCNSNDLAHEVEELEKMFSEF